MTAARVADYSGQLYENGPPAVWWHSSLLVKALLGVLSPARVATWRAFEVPWGHLDLSINRFLYKRSAYEAGLSHDKAAHQIAM
jgi:hypothetical protein